MSKYCLFLCIQICISLALTGQNASFFVIDQVLFEENKKTKDYVVAWEMDLIPGDTVWLSTLAERFQYNKARILNTGLFSYVEIDIEDWDTLEQKANIKVTLQENWYLYPAPIFDLGDRSFNVWWQEMNRSLDRINYGLSVDHINLTGNYDRLKIKLQRGYQRKYEIKYRFPYLSRNGWGMELNTLFSEAREIGYLTEGNKTIFFQAEDDRMLRNRFRTGIAFTQRPNQYFRQSVRLEFHRNTIDDIVAEDLNANYFSDSAASLKFFLLNYRLEYDKIAYRIYPLGGYQLSVQAKKEGLGIFDEIDILGLTLGYDQYFSFGNKWRGGARLRAKANLSRNQVPFANNTGLGYGKDLVRGYELYVVDGTDWFVGRTHWAYQVFQKTLINNLLPLRQYRRVDIQMFVRWTFDVGYVNEPTYSAGNPLANEWMVGFGPALDFILFNTVLVNFEYNINKLGEGGFFIKSRNAF